MKQYKFQMFAGNVKFREYDNVVSVHITDTIVMIRLTPEQYFFFPFDKITFENDIIVVYYSETINES